VRGRRSRFEGVRETARRRRSRTRKKTSAGGGVRARASPSSLLKPETIICFCLIDPKSLYKYLYLSLTIIGNNL